MTQPSGQGRLAAYSAGNKVYGSGRPHPTSGPVDPAGYVERKFNKGASNRRSGLAAAAGRKLAATQQPAEQAQPQTPVAAALASTMIPLALPDGRRIAPNATGQYEWITGPGEVKEEIGGNGHEAAL